MKKLVIDVVSDVMCPWCYIGAKRLSTALEGAGVDAELRYHPFLLDASLPEEGVDLRERLQKKYGADPARMFERVESEARSAGIPMDFTKIIRSYPTVHAHTLLRHAARRGTQRALADALFASYFLLGRNVADAEVLADIAAPHGFTRTEVKALVGDERERAQTVAEAESARQQGVSGVPLYVLDGKLALSGAQRVEQFRAAIERLVYEAA
jgi:predicted DsbA family dithiol-disulfide isomerase